MSESTNRAVFLSYASQDADAARRIAEALRAAGVEVWFDQNELRGGDSWDQKIRKQIRECALFVPIISANTETRPEGYFRLEWHLAEQRSHLIARGRPFIVPVCVDDTRDSEALVPEVFLAVQWTRLRPAGRDFGGQARPEGDVEFAAFAERTRRLLTDDPSSRSPAQAIASDLPATRSSLLATAQDNSVAVLAFASLSNDPENEFFSDGISEELINVLVRVPGLKVSARTSAFHFKGRNTPVPEIAHQLGVAYVVEGSVRKAGDRVRITAQLIKAADGFHVWSDTFTRDLKDIFAVQDEIAGLIAKNLSLKLGAPSQAKREVNPEAYRLFLEGRSIFNRESPVEYPKAIECFEESLKIDPDSALPWAALSMVYSMCAGSGTMPIHDGNKLALEAAEKAAALDPESAKAHLALAFIELLYGWNWKKARALVDRTLELAPGDAEAMSMLAHLATITGKKGESIALAQRALDLDPLNTFTNFAFVRSLGSIGRFEEMERHAARMIAVNPAGIRGGLFLCIARLELGRIDEAARVAEEMPPGWPRHTGLACVRAAQGRMDESESELNALKAENIEHAPYQIAEVHAFRGEIDLAFEWLEKSYLWRDSGTVLARCDHMLKNLHADPRWEPFLRKMNLADDQLR